MDFKLTDRDIEFTFQGDQYDNEYNEGTKRFKNVGLNADPKNLVKAGQAIAKLQGDSLQKMVLTQKSQIGRLGILEMAEEKKNSEVKEG